ELTAQEELLPSPHAVSFGMEEAQLAAHLYRVVPRARRREFDLAVAACALTHGATFWTLNTADFRDIPDLQLYAPARA
ncbi:MAG: type II toxin-antitoxin system VapC family toxin, partial [Gammaproteobacteria bacterium]